MGRKGNINWSKEMKIVLLEFIIRHKDHIHGSFSPKITTKSKASLWNQIHDELVVMGYDGGLIKLKKNYNNLVSRTKAKIYGANRTGSGKPEELDEIDEMVLMSRDISIFYKNNSSDPKVTFRRSSGNGNGKDGNDGNDGNNGNNGNNDENDENDENDGNCGNDGDCGNDGNL